VVSRVATGLGAAGIVAGHRVMLALGNRLEFVTTYLGVLRAQAVAVPVNPTSTVDELGRMFADSGSRMVVADPDTVEGVRSAVASAPSRVEIVVVGSAAGPGERSYDDLLASEVRPVPPLRDPEKLAVLLYTSGTSGRPRAAMLTHRALIANVEQVATVEPPMIHSDDVVLGVLPLFHVYGLNAVLGGVLRHRAKLVLTERFDPEGTLDLIEDEACSVVPVAPPVFAHWGGVEALEERLGPVRLFLSGSAPLSAELIEEFTRRTGIPIHQGYGLTEAAPVVTTTLRSAEPEPGSVGAPLDGIELRLVDDDGRPLSEAENGDPGEIQIRGDNLFSGYWPDGADGPDADGWWSTGDVGVLDAAGDLHLVDRVKELVIVSGFNVYPAEVEAVIEEVDGVAVAAVIGVADELTGEAVVAYVVPTDSGDPQGLADAIAEHCSQRLARFKHPSRIEVVDELPRTVTGQVQKGRLRGRERRRALGILE
jgi:long-chain acyl-CoA synthetase